MTRLALAALMALPASGALAGDPPLPVCGRPAVLDEVGAVLAQAGRRIVLEPYPIGEVSAGPGRLISCAARGYVLAYDTPRYGMQPLYEPLVIRYTLELRRHGIFVRVQ